MNKQEFKYFYNDKIYPILKPYEEERKKILNTSLKRDLQGCIVIGITFVICLPLGLLENEACIPILIIGSAIAKIFSAIADDGKTYKVRDFKMAIKALCLNKILEAFGDLKWYVSENIEEGGSKSEIIEGSHKGVQFKLKENENHLYLTFQTNKKFKTKTAIENRSIRISNVYLSYFSLIGIFLGYIALFLTCTISMDISGDVEMITIIVFGIIMSIIIAIMCLNTIFKYHGFSKTNLEDTAFNKDFAVYTKNEVDARYFLSPSFMERFKNLKTVFGSCKISCYVENNMLTIKLGKPKDLFEIVDIKTPFINPKTIMVLYNEIQAIFDMIEYFKFEENTGI